MDGIGDQPHDVRGGVRSPLIAVVGSIRPIGSGGGRRRPQKVPVRCRRRHVVVGCYGLGSGAKVGQVGRSVGFKNQIRHEMCWNSIQFNSIQFFWNEAELSFALPVLYLLLGSMQGKKETWLARLMRDTTNDTPSRNLATSGPQKKWHDFLWGHIRISPFHVSVE